MFMYFNSQVDKHVQRFFSFFTNIYVVGCCTESWSSGDACGAGGGDGVSLVQGFQVIFGLKLRQHLWSFISIFVINYIDVKINYSKWGLRIRCTYNYFSKFKCTDVIFKYRCERWFTRTAACRCSVSCIVELRNLSLATLYLLRYCEAVRFMASLVMFRPGIAFQSNSTVKFVSKVWRVYWHFLFRSELPRDWAWEFSGFGTQEWFAAPHCTVCPTGLSCSPSFPKSIKVTYNFLSFYYL